LELLEMAGLSHLREQLAVEISGGQKKLLEFMRTMMADPEVILLDEPFAGVNPALIERLIDVTIELNQTREKTFLLISHDIPSVMKLCKHLTVLSAGTTIAEGASENVRHDPAVIDAYLGH
jgi:ABC-type branched-subunit amino acid transport system ATPase component